jgi:hypothetical protein
MDKVIGVIPEVFYDLIGRIIPGTLFIVFFSFISDPCNKFSLELFFKHISNLVQKDIHPLSVFILILLAYVVGAILSSVGSFCFILLGCLMPKLYLAIPFLRKFKFNSISTRTIYRLSQKQDGSFLVSKLLKMQAEMALTEGLMIASLVLICLSKNNDTRILLVIFLGLNFAGRIALACSGSDIVKSIVNHPTK